MNPRRSDSGEVSASEIERMWKWMDQQAIVNRELEKRVGTLEGRADLLTFKSSLWTLVGAMIAAVGFISFALLRCRLGKHLRQAGIAAGF